MKHAKSPRRGAKTRPKGRKYDERYPSECNHVTQGKLFTLTRFSSKCLKTGKSLRSVAMFLLHGSIVRKNIVRPQHRTICFIVKTRDRHRAVKAVERSERLQKMAQRVITEAEVEALSLGSLVDRIRDRWHRWRSFNAAYAELNALSTQQLADLGLSRSMISRLAHEAASKKSPG